MKYSRILFTPLLFALALLFGNSAYAQQTEQMSQLHLVEKSSKSAYGIPDSIEIHWKTWGFGDIIPNIQKQGFKSGWVDLFPEAHSDKPYVVHLPSEVSQVYGAIAKNDMGNVDLEEFSRERGMHSY